MSNVGFRIDHVPIASEVIKSAKILQVNSYDLALYGGEEYELVVTIKRNCWKKAQHVIMEAGGTLIRIGEVTEHEDILLMNDERDELIPYKGWEHFKTTYNFREM